MDEEELEAQSFGLLLAVTVFFASCRYGLNRRSPKKIDQSISMVAEIEQIADRGKSRLKSRAQISDGSPRRFFLTC
jgi:hypothetical protein